MQYENVTMSSNALIAFSGLFKVKKKKNKNNSLTMFSLIINALLIGFIVL